MELKNFISSIVKDIVEAVTNAQSELGELGAHICPPVQYRQGIDDAGSPMQLVEFDVAVTADRETENQNKKSFSGAIKVLSAEVGNNGKTVLSESTTNRIKFSIPISLPISKQRKQR